MTKKKKIINSIELKYEVSLSMKLNQIIKCYINYSQSIQHPIIHTLRDDIIMRKGPYKWRLIPREGKKTVNHFISSQR
jgi:hypothetical protein